MSERSFERINYALRPAKCIERRMMTEALSRLGLVAPLSSYRYVGFGSVDFVDFRLVHIRLGVRDMVSIEAAESVSERFRFNRPFSCIELQFGVSGDVLPTLSWAQRTITWLDYDGKLTRAELDDVGTVVSAAPPGSALIVTVNCQPEKIPDDAPATAPDIHTYRYAELAARVGRELVPGHIEPKDLRNWGLADACWEIIESRIAESLANRNAALTDLDKIGYDQLFHFRYADGARMLTIGGVLLSAAERKTLDPREDFADLDYIRAGKEAFTIDVPVLTLREMRLLDQTFPSLNEGRGTQDWPFLPPSHVEFYRKVYRYFPTFLEVEAR